MPVSCIVETIRPDARDIRSLGVDGHVLAIRGEVLPIVRLGALLGLEIGPFDPAGKVLVHMSIGGTSPIALAVDSISDQRQVVIKSLEANYGSIPGISAATILGDGTIALILDPEHLARMAARPDAAPAAPRPLEYANG